MTQQAFEQGVWQALIDAHPLESHDPAEWLRYGVALLQTLTPGAEAGKQQQQAALAFLQAQKEGASAEAMAAAQRQAVLLNLHQALVVGSVRMGAATLSAVPKLLHRHQVALHSQPPGGWHLPSGLAPLKPSTVCADGCLTYCRSSDLWRSELLQQHCQGFTQLEPVAGGVCEEESALSSKASILDSSAASRLFSISSSFVRFLLSSSRCSMS